MKRYFLAPITDMPALAQGQLPFPGEYHYIDLSSHGTAGTGYAAVVLFEHEYEAPAGWSQLPHLLETTLMSDPTQAANLAKLADVGVLATHNTFTAAKTMAAIFKPFKP